MALEFEWDPAKATGNARKHRVTFAEAMTAFADPLGGVLDDPEHALGEPRLILLAWSSRGRLLAVMFTERGPERVRLISARPAPAPSAAAVKKASAERPPAPERDSDEIAPEYDFRGARPNPYAARYAPGAQAVVLDPDVAAAFPDAAAVNGALRGLLELARCQARVAEEAPAA